MPEASSVATGHRPRAVNVDWNVVAVSGERVGAVTTGRPESTRTRIVAVRSRVPSPACTTTGYEPLGVLGATAIVIVVAASPTAFSGCAIVALTGADASAVSVRSPEKSSARVSV